MKVEIFPDQSNVPIFGMFLEENFAEIGKIETEVFELNTDFGYFKSSEKVLNSVKTSHRNIEIYKPLQFSITDFNPVVEMHFHLKGDSFGVRNKDFCFDSISSNQHNLIYNSNDFDTLHLIPLENSNEVFEVQFELDYFSNLVSFSPDIAENFQNSIVQKRNSTLSEKNLPISREMQLVIQQITTSNKSGLMEKLFIESKTLELLYLQLEVFQKVNNSKIEVVSSRKDSIYFVKELIENNFQNPFSIAQLSKLACLNEFTLKSEFKKTFNKTIFEYVCELKMNFAKEQLLYTNKNIFEISEEVGYKNSNHFSTAFKRYFGKTPKEFKL